MPTQLQQKVPDITLDLPTGFTQVTPEDTAPFYAKLDTWLNEIDVYEHTEGIKVSIYHTYTILPPQQIEKANLKDYLQEEAQTQVNLLSQSHEMIRLQPFALFTFTLNNAYHQLAISSYKGRALLVNVSYPNNLQHAWQGKSMQLLHSITLNTKLQDFYQFAQVHPQIKAYLEQGYSLSLPYPMHQKKPMYKKWELVFFLYKEQEVAAGTYQQSPPDWYVLINFSTFKTSKLIKARPSKFGLKTANLQAFEKTDFTPPSPTETKQFFSLYTTLLVLYFEGKQKGTKEEIATIQQGRELLFGNMLSAPMQPYFRSINPYFVKWLYQF